VQFPHRERREISQNTRDLEAVPRGWFRGFVRSDRLRGMLEEKAALERLEGELNDELVKK
jgi:hypothetical protein